MASVNRASPLSQGFVSFLCKPRNISFCSFLSHSFIHQRRFSRGFPWIPRGLDPGRRGVLMLTNMYKHRNT